MGYRQDRTLSLERLLMPSAVKRVVTSHNTHERFHRSQHMVGHALQPSIGSLNLSSQLVLTHMVSDDIRGYKWDQAQFPPELSFYMSPTAPKSLPTIPTNVE